MGHSDPTPGPPAEGGAGASGDILDSRAAGGTALRGSVLRASGFVGGLALALVSAPLLVRHLGDAEFGRYSAVLAVIAIVTGLTEGGINTVALRELSAARTGAERDRMMGDLLGLRLVLSVAGVLFAVVFSVAAGYRSDLVLGTFLAGLGMLAAVSQTLIATALQSRLRFGWAAAIELARQAAATALIVVLVVADAGTAAFLATGIFGGLVALALTLKLVRGSVALMPALHPRRWAALLKDTFVFAVAVAVNSLYFRVGLVLLSLTATAAETGYFAVSFRIIELLIGVPSLVIGAAFPILSRAVLADRERFDTATARLFELGVMAGTMLSLCLLLAAPFAIEVLVGTDDHPAVPVLQIQSAAILASFVASATGYPLLSMHRHRETLIANGVALVLAAALTLALAPSYGAQGAAVGAVVADFALASVNGALLVRKGGPRLPLTIIPLTAIAAGLGYAAGHVAGVHPLVEASVGGLVFLAVLALFGRLPPEIREVVTRRVRGPATGPA